MKKILTILLIFACFLVCYAHKIDQEAINEIHTSFTEGKIELANLKCQQYLSTYQNSDLLNLEYSRLNFYLMDFDKAITYYKKIENKNNAYLNYYGGILYMYHGINNFKAIFKIPSVPFYFKKAQNLFQQGFSSSPRKFIFIDPLIGLFHRTPWILGGSDSKTKKLLASLKSYDPLFHTYAKTLVLDNPNYQETFINISSDSLLYEESSDYHNVLFDLSLHFNRQIALKHFKLLNPENSSTCENFTRLFAFFIHKDKDYAQAKSLLLLDYFSTLPKPYQAWTYGKLAHSSPEQDRMKYLDKALELDSHFWRTTTAPPHILWLEPQAFFD